MHVENPLRKTKSIPGMHGSDGNPRRRAIACAGAELVEMSVVECAKAFEVTIDEPLASIRSVSELVTVKVIDARRNGHVLEDVEG